MITPGREIGSRLEEMASRCRETESRLQETGADRLAEGPDCRILNTDRLADDADQVAEGAVRVSCGILVVMLRSLPSRQCIRRGAQPGCTWLDEPELAVPPTRGTPRLAKSPKPVAGWRGQTKTPTPKAVAT